jgi:hypothetical protein
MITLLQAKAIPMKDGDLLHIDTASSFGGHFLGNPEADAASYEAEPDHEIILPRAVKAGDGVSYQTRVKEE